MVAEIENPALDMEDAVKKKAFIWRESVYKNDCTCKCGAKLMENGVPTDNLAKNGDNPDDPRLFCMKCHAYVGIEKEIDTELSGNLGEYEPEERLEMDAFVFAVGNLSLSPFKRRENRKFIAILNNQKGFLGVKPEYPRGTLLFFDTLNNAKGARNILRSKGVDCGDNIVTVKIDPRYVGR